MKLKKINKHKLIAFGAVLLVAAIVICAVIITDAPVKTKNYFFNDENQQGVSFDKGFDIGIEGDSAKLLLNSSNGAVALVSSNGKTVFNSCSADAAKYSLAAVVSVRLRDDNGNSYTMNSTDNSVKFGAFKIDSSKDNKLTIDFNLFPDKDRADKGVEKADIYIGLSVELALSDGGFTTSVDAGKVLLPEGFCLEKLSILPGLFSVDRGLVGDYYTVPDGCGAQIQLSAINNEDYSLNLGVYGSDSSLYGYSVGAALPYFAYTHGGCLVNTIITEGDALSEISLKKFSHGGGYLYNTFTITACGVLDGDYVSGSSYGGKVTQLYNFTEGDTDYNEIALQVKDSLIGRGYLAAGLSEKVVAMPTFVNVLGSYDGKDSFTTFSQAAEISTILRSKGINNIVTRFIGGAESGICSVADESLEFSSSLGGDKALKELADKMSEQGNKLYVDYNAMISQADYSGSTVTVYNDVARYSGAKSENFSVANVSDIDKNISEGYKKLIDLPDVGVCLNDGSMLLYTDFEDGLTRQDVLAHLQGSVNSLNAATDVILSYPAVYLMKYVKGIASVPEAASLQKYYGVTAVPVLQIAIHGSVVYGTNPINVSNLSSVDALLKAVEYGAVPSFLFTHKQPASLGYGAYVTGAADLYERAAEVKDLLGKAITSHEVVTSGVYRVTYEYSDMVYVNYNPSVVEVDGILIPAKDFIVL